jgi:transposase
MRKSRKTVSLDLRERIMACYDEGKLTQQEVAERFRVSVGLVKKLRAQRQETGDLAPRHHKSGRKPLLTATHRQRIGQLIKEQPDITLAEMREALALRCTLPAIHYVVRDLKLTFKKNAARQRARARRRQGPA